MSVVEAVTAELAKLPEDVGTSGLAAVATAMAERIDDPSTRPAAAAMCAQRLQDALAELHKIAPSKSEDDDIERARKRRAARFEGQSTTRPAASS